MSDFTAGYEFQAGEKNITHSKLNAIISGLVANPSFISGRSEESSIDSGDYLMFLDVSANAFKKISKSNMFPTLTAVTTVSQDITQAAHGFVVGDVIYRASGSWAKAKTDAAATAEALGVVSVVGSVNTFTVVFSGVITGLSGLTDGTLYYVSAATAGLLTATAPSTNSHLLRPVLIATSATTGIVINQARVKISATGGIESSSGAAIESMVGELRGTRQVNAQTGTSYTVLTGDRGKLVTHNNASAIAVTLPQAGTGFENGWYDVHYNLGAGRVTITPTISTINGAASLYLDKGQAAFISSDGTNYSAVVLSLNVEALASLTSNFTTTSGTLTNITGLSFPVLNGETWHFEACLFCGTDNGNGMAFSVTAPTGNLDVGFHSVHSSQPTGSNDCIHSSGGATRDFHAYNSGSAADSMTLLRGTLVATAGGTVQLQVRSQTAGNTTTIGRGSWLRARRV